MIENIQTYFTELFSSVGLNDLLDILIATFVIYKILEYIKKTRAQQLVRGLVMLVAVYFLAGILDLHIVQWFLGGAFTVGLFALVVVFQPEIRRGLEVMGRVKIGKGGLVRLDNERGKRISDEVADAIAGFSATKTGALIIFERDTTLEDIAETGTRIDAEISEALLGNLFYEGAPLHDGAVLIREGRVYAAGCVLPLTESKTLNKSLGTRHRAGIGITEKSDALALIVSEETGIISLAQDGRISRFLDKRNVEKILLNVFVNGEEESPSRFARFRRRLGGGKHVAK